MDIKIAKEVIECLPQGKTAFHYYKDRYAAFILSQVISESCHVSDLKKSDYSGLLNKPMIKDVVARSGNGILSREQLDLLWADSSEPFLLSLDTWGQGQRNWDQVSRSGHNLVLQLNFSNKHDELFRKLVNPDHDNNNRDHSFRYFDHPVMKKGKRDLFRETLAWARIDFDFNTNEALIEELQTLVKDSSSQAKTDRAWSWSIFFIWHRHNAREIKDLSDWCVSNVWKNMGRGNLNGNYAVYSSGVGYQ